MKFYNIIKNNSDKSFLIVFTVIYCIVFTLTYNKWGLVLIDCFHEMYIAKIMLSGSYLYKDIPYLYGPFVPYLYTLLFNIFGLNLNTAYILGGLVSYLYCFIFIFIARKLLSLKETILATILLLIICVFSPAIKGYIFPYSIAATIGNLFAISTLYCLICFVENKNKRWLLHLASFISGFSVLVKHEYAFVAVVITLVTVILLTIKREINIKDLILSGFAAIFIPFLVFLYFLTYVKVNLINDVLLNPTFFKSAKYYSLTFLKGGITIFAFANGSSALLLLTLTFFLGLIYTFVSNELRKKNRFFSIILLAVLIFVCIFSGGLQLIVNFLTNNFLDTFAGLGILNILIFIYILFFYKEHNRILLILLAAYSILIAIRTPLYYSLQGYTSFYIPTTFILFIYFLFHICPTLPILKQIKHGIVSCSYFLLIVIATFFLIFDVGYYNSKQSTLYVPDIGRISMNPVLYPAIADTISFITNNTTNKDRIFVIPEEISFYIFCNRFAPGKFYYLNPGIIDNSNKYMDSLLNSFEKKKPKYIIVSNLPKDDFGIDNILEYYKPVKNYILKHYKVIQVYKTGFIMAKDTKYSITIYQRSIN